MPSIRLNRRRALLFSAVAAVAGVLTISACSSEENPPAGTLTLAVVPSSINVAAGGTGSAAAAITRGGSFTGAVTLSATGNPTGVTVTFTPATVAAGATAATIAVAVAGTVAPGSKPITISATGSGVTTATATLTVVVIGEGAGAIALAANPASLTGVAVGAAAVTSAITLTRTAPFAGAVGLTVTGAPANVTATVNPTSVAAGATTSTLSVSAAAGAVSGTYPLVIHGTGTGVADATVTVNATVTGGAAGGASFTFAPTPLPITAGGANATSTVTIARTGTFAPSGALNLTVASATAGLTATVTPNTNVTGNTATVTATATGAVAAGTYDLTLTGTGTGIPNAVGTLPVTVTGGGGGGGSVTAAFCTADAPIWVAQQDGSGAWTRLNPSTGSTYTFNFASGKGGVAIVDTVGTGYELSVVYATVADFNAYSTTVNAGGCGEKTVNGSVLNVSAAEVATVSLGYSRAVVIPALSTTFQLQDVADGPQDLVATRTDATTFTTNKLILRRNQDINNNQSLAVLDFNAVESFPPVTANVTVTGLVAGDNASISSLYTGTYGSAFAPLSTVTSYSSTSGAVPYYAVPVGNLTTNDLQELVASLSDATNGSRSAGVFFRAPTNRSIAMGAALSTPTVTKTIVGTNALPQVTLASQASYNRLLNASFDQDGLNNTANVFATANYFGGLPATWTLALPNLTAVSGYLPAWGLASGTGVNWFVSAQGGKILFIDGNTIVDGDAFASASRLSSTPVLRGARSSPASLMSRLSSSLRNQQGNPRH